MKDKIKLLFRKALIIIYLITTFFVFVLWTIFYPLLRNRYRRTKNPKHFPSKVLFNTSMYLQKSLSKFIS